MGDRNSTKLPESFYSNGHSIGELEVVADILFLCRLKAVGLLLTQ